MCLITFAYQQHPRYSLVLLANRDEFYARPSRPMHFWEDHPEILAGRDLEQGGTWLGLTTAGKLATVTNFRDGRNPVSNARSRGDLTRHYLCNTLSADDYLNELLPVQADYGLYNLLLGDARGLFYQSNRDGPVRKITPGIYGLSNALLDTAWPKLEQVRTALRQAIDADSLVPEQLLNIMLNPAQAEPDQLPDTGISPQFEQLLSSAFIQSENYGTRATTLLLQQPNGTTDIYELNHDPDASSKSQQFRLNLPPIG